MKPFRRRAARRWLPGAGVVLCLAAAVVAWQAQLHSDRHAALTQEIDRLEEARARAGAAARRREALEAELARVEADLVRLRAILPASFDVNGFVRAFEARHGVEVLVVEDRPGGSGALESRDVAVVLFGDRSATRRVPAVGRPGGPLPLFFWEAEEETEGEVEGVLTLLARPPEPVRPFAWQAHGTVEGVWLWPCSSRLARLRTRRDQLAAELRKDEALLDRLQLFEARKAELASCVDAINGLTRGTAGAP